MQMNTIYIYDYIASNKVLTNLTEDLKQANKGINYSKASINFMNYIGIDGTIGEVVEVAEGKVQYKKVYCDLVDDYICEWDLMLN